VSDQPHISFQPETIRDEGFRQRIREKLGEIQAIRQEHNFLAYATHAHLFTELEALYAENLAAFRQDYLEHKNRLGNLQHRLKNEEKPIHPLRLQEVQALVTQIEAQLEPEDYQQNQEAGPLLDQLEKRLTEAEKEFQGWEKDLAQWREQLKVLMHKVWAEDYHELKADYQSQKELTRSSSLPRLPLAPLPEKVEQAEARRAEAETKLLNSFRFHPRLRKKAATLQDRYLPLNLFQTEARKLRKQAFRRRALGLVGLVLVSGLTAAGLWYTPLWLNAQAEAEAWILARQEHSLESYVTYLQQYPDGLHADSALNARLAFPEGKLSGLTSSEGKIFDYEGELEQLLPHGKGIALFADSGRYEGYWRQGLRDSSGTMQYANGDRYEGAWQNDRPHGQGNMTYANGDVYRGAWKNGKSHGWGVLEGKNGKQYKGGWQNGQPQGKGTYRYVDGSSYDGYWENGLYDGNGRYSDAVGTAYTGKWVKNKKQGEGQLTWENGARFTGVWQADTINGQGIFVSRFRDQLSGVWKGSPSRISFYDGAGNLIKQGRWEDGLFLAK
jgi:hypothetical protein